MMEKNQLSLLFYFIYVVLLWPHVQSVRIFSPENSADVSSEDQGKQRPRVEKRSVRGCDTTFENFCFNNGRCVFLTDENTNTCKCQLGFHGSRCETPQFVIKPLGEDQVALIIVSVILLIIGLAGALYFFCKWFRRNRLPQQQKRREFTGVQTA